DQESMFVTYYNHPYYNSHLERLGYQKDTDWVEYKIFVPKETDPVYQKISNLSALVLERNNYHIANPKKRSEYKPYIHAFFELVNDAYTELYGTVDLTQQQIEKYADKFIPLVNPDYLCLVLDETEKLVGFGVCCPSMAKALKKCHGKLFPFGWTGILRALRKNTYVDLLLIAVRPELQKKGVNAVIIDHIMKSCVKNNIVYAESGPQLETNSKVLSQWRQFRAEQHKRRRCYVKELF
ncbi:MAG: hypothetical protein IKN57_05665, partial [Parasporobacterium sp.]|nr:hypothetical protein [Parasporobacterium sp.]